MHIVVCLDDRNGMQFNHRRLSSDQAVCQRLFAQHSGRLMMNSTSAKLFAGMDIIADDAFLRNATAADTCFVEDLEFVDYLPKISKITVYRWNRHYPSDVKFPQQVLAEWCLEATEDFAGNSHDHITEERYVR